MIPRSLPDRERRPQARGLQPGSSSRSSLGDRLGERGVAGVQHPIEVAPQRHLATSSTRISRVSADRPHGVDATARSTWPRSILDPTVSGRLELVPRRPSGAIRGSDERGLPDRRPEALVIHPRESGHRHVSGTYPAPLSAGTISAWTLGSTSSAGVGAPRDPSRRFCAWRPATIAGRRTTRPGWPPTILDG